jgi:hypothetical protein
MLKQLLAEFLQVGVMDVQVHTAENAVGLIAVAVSRRL